MNPIDDQFLASLTGQTEAHLSLDAESGYLMHTAVVRPFKALRAAAREAGFDLAVASSFRSFERQRIIWNEKATGQRPVLNDAGEVLDISQWKKVDKALAILRWSALPGASRHHWGSDLDIYDRRALGPEGRLELTSAECEEGGPFYPLHQWLDDYLPATGFYRPYAVDRGGVGREPWHISFRPVARRYEQALTPARLHAVLARTDVVLADTLLEHLDNIYTRFIALPDDGR